MNQIYAKKKKRILSKVTRSFISTKLEIITEISVFLEDDLIPLITKLISHSAVVFR